MDTKKLKDILTIFENSKITKMNLEDENIKLTLEKASFDTSKVIVQEEVASKLPLESVENIQIIKSPLVGTYYQASGQDQLPFVKVGDVVKEGDCLCIIEAMKVMNELKSPCKGRIKDILVNDGQTIEFNQDLIVIDLEEV